MKAELPLPTAIDSHSDSRAGAHRWAMLALAALSIAFWMLIHPYRGLEHDSVLYAVLALARLHPAALGHDLLVRYGAQDHYTIFSPLFAAAIQAAGLERGAALLAFATYVVFFASVYGQDLVQNDPWLRGDVIRLYSRGADNDALMMHRQFPRLHEVYADRYGTVWSPAP